MTYDYPIWYIFLSFLISGLLSFLMYKKNIKTSWKFISMAFLRFLSLVIVFILIGGLLVTTTIKSKVKPKLVVAFDQSSSMLQNASMDKLQSVFSDFNNPKLSENYSIKNIGFGKSVSRIDTLKIDKPRTNFENLEKKLDLLLSENDEVILVSDGNINSGNSSVFGNKKKYNLNVIGVGDSSINASISITRINHNKKVIIGNSFPVELFIETSNYSGDVKLEISEKSKIVYSDKFSILPNSELHQKHRHSILMKSSRKGTHVYKVRLLSGIDNKLTTEKIIAVDFVENRGVVLIEYKYLNPDISLFKRNLSARNYKVLVTSKVVSQKELNKFDFVVDFDGSANNKSKTPAVHINSRAKGYKNTSQLIDTGLDKKYFKSYSINSKSKQIYIDANNLWQLNLNEAKRNEKNLDSFFDSLLKDIELLMYSDKFNVVFKDVYSSSENVVIRLINESSNMKSVDAKAEIVINGKKQTIDFVEENNGYTLNLGRLTPSAFTSKIIVNGKRIKTINFVVKEFNLELLGESQNIEVLKMIASNQKGSYYSLDNYTNLIDKLSLESSNIITIKKEKNNLIEKWWMLFLLPLILGAEWLLRKRNGLY